MKLAMRLGVVCEALTDQDAFAWRPVLLGFSCLVIGFSLSGGTNSITDSLLDAKEKGAKTVLVSQPASPSTKDSQKYTGHTSPSKQFISIELPFLPLLIVVDLIYAHFLNKSLRTKGNCLFNSYRETKTFLVNVLENLNMVSYLKSMKDQIFFIFHAFLMNQNKSPTRLVLCSMFLSKVVVGPNIPCSILMVGKFQRILSRLEPVPHTELDRF